MTQVHWLLTFLKNIVSTEYDYYNYHYYYFIIIILIDEFYSDTISTTSNPTPSGIIIIN